MGSGPGALLPLSINPRSITAGIRIMSRSIRHGLSTALFAGIS